MDLDRQRAQTRAALERKLQTAKDAGKQKALIRWSDLAAEDWAKDLTREQILDLIQLELEQGPWVIVTRHASEERFLGAEYTDRDGFYELYSG
jgi:hypothetical protein